VAAPWHGFGAHDGRALGSAQRHLKPRVVHDEALATSRRNLRAFRRCRHC
jgi:hypothetical protein